MVSDLSPLSRGSDALTCFGLRPAAPHPTQIASDDLASLLVFTDAALEVFRKNEGKLNGMEVRLRSLLAVVRYELADELAAQDDSAA